MNALHARIGEPSRIGEGEHSTHPLAALGRVLKGKHDLLDAEFVTLQETTTQRFLGRAIRSNNDGAELREKVFRIVRSTQYPGSYTIKACTRLYLTCELNDKVTVDRQQAKSFEQWHLHFGHGGAVVVQSRRNNRYVTVRIDGRSLVAATAGRHGAARWVLRAAACRSEVGCWGAEHGVWGERFAAEENNHDSLNIMFPLITSPKPLPQLQPLHPEDPYDGVTNARRTLRNWASIPGVAPVVLTKDPIYRAVVAEQNAFRRRLPDGKLGGNRTARCEDVLLHDVVIDGEYEVQRRFDQPTYRGLFKRAFALYPDAPAVMLSNADVLYTAGLSETLRAVLRFVEGERRTAEREGRPSSKSRWMVVGQRVNRDVPPTWTIQGSPRINGTCPRTPQWAHAPTATARGQDGSVAVFEKHTLLFD